MRRLNEIQVALKAPKDSQAEKYKYRSAEDILESVKPLLEKTGTAVVLTDEILDISGRMFLKATATLKAFDGDIATSIGYAELDAHISRKWDAQKREWYNVKSMSNEQAIGCASSYARKYALCGLFAIDNSENDPDRDEISHDETTEPQAKKKAVAVNNTPAPQTAPQTQESGQGDDLTEGEQDEYLTACADMDAAVDREALEKIYKKYEKTNFAKLLGIHAAAICKRKGWEKKDGKVK